MKIALLVDTFPRWSERFIAREAAELLRRGCDLTVLALRCGEPPKADDPEWSSFAGRVVFLPSAPQALFSADNNVAKSDAMFSASAVEGFRRRAGKLARIEKIKGSARVAQAAILAHILRKGAYDRVVAHFAGLPSSLAWVACGAVGIPLFMSVHARDIFVEAQLLSEKMRDSQVVICCCQTSVKKLSTLPGSENKIQLIPHGLPLDLFAFPPAPDRNDSVPRLVAAGRFVPKKGWMGLAAILSHPALRRKNWRLECFGEGPLKKTFVKAIAGLGLKSKVIFNGEVSGPTLWRSMRSARAFLAPYVPAADGDQDGVPNVLLEAMALGLPIVAFRSGGIPEIADKHTAFIAASGDARDFAVALCACLDDPEEANRRAFAARKYVETSRDIRKTIGAWLQLLR